MRKSELDALHELQAELDCWLELGATPNELREGAFEHIAGILDDLHDIYKDVSRMENIALPRLQALYAGLRALNMWEEHHGDSFRHEAEKEELIRDYGRWAGICVLEDDKDVEPATYLLEYMWTHEQPPKEVVSRFLREFYEESFVENWLRRFIWPEDDK